MDKTKLELCPICGAELQIHGPEDWKPSFYDPDSGGDPYNATCKCGFSFSTGTYDHEEFFEACNRRAILPDNKALTVEELRGMGGKPVWVVCLYPKGQFWHKDQWVICGISLAEEVLISLDNNVLIEVDCGKGWLAYRRQTERED